MLHMRKTRKNNHWSPKPWFLPYDWNMDIGNYVIRSCIKARQTGHAFPLEILWAFCIKLLAGVWRPRLKCLLRLRPTLFRSPLAGYLSKNCNPCIAKPCMTRTLTEWYLTCKLTEGICIVPGSSTGGTFELVRPSHSLRGNNSHHLGQVLLVLALYKCSIRPLITMARKRDHHPKCAEEETSSAVHPTYLQPCHWSTTHNGSRHTWNEWVAILSAHAPIRACLYCTYHS